MRTKIGLILVVGSTLLAACTAVTDQPVESQSTTIPTLVDACGTAEQFLKAWDANDYRSMYGLVSSRSLATSQTQFSTTYQAVDQVMGGPSGTKKAFQFNCDNAVLQGTTAAITYDMTFNSVIAGSLTDTGRTMRLLWTSPGWRVAWSKSDIFDGLAGDAVLNLEYIPAVRGSIFDRNGKPFAQDNQTLYTVKLLTNSYPKKPDDCFIEISSIFRRKLADVLTAYKGLTGLQYGEIVGTLDVDTYNAKHTELDSVCTVTYSPRQATRVYYDGGLAAQTVGYISPIPGDQADQYPNYSPNSLIGRDGIEQKFERELSGKAGVALTIRLPDNTLIRTLTQQVGLPGVDVKLTLDRNLQDATEHAINDAYSYAAPSWGQFSTGAAAVVVDVHTGQILALASYPSFDVDVFNPNTTLPAKQILYSLSNPSPYTRSPLVNLATQEYSALGSVFKISSMAAALESGLFKPDTIYDDNTGIWDGRKQFGDTLLRYDWIALDPTYKDVGNKHGPLTLVQALIASCDVCFWQVGAVLNQKDPNLLSKYALQMGLGQSTGLSDLPQADLVGQLPSPTNIVNIQNRAWAVGDALNEVIGQGDVKVTALQVARMMAAIANGGTLWQPYLVQSIGTDSSKIGVTTRPQKQGDIGLSQSTLSAITQGLCGVTMDKKIGTAEWFLDNWNFSQIALCGKTGTAQTGTTHPNGWFAAIAGPPGKPDIAVVVLVEHGREGSETAGPIVRRIVEAYYHIPYNNWPLFWSQPYVPMADPNASDGGGRHSLAGGN